jgi:DNA polymerase III alpha subunit
MLKNFAPFHIHPLSLDSASTPEAFAKKEVELGTGALTCTDHGSLAASYRIYDLAKKSNLIPVIGAELYLRQNDCPILTKLGIPKTDIVPRGMDKTLWKQNNPNGTFFEYAKYFHLTVHCKDFKSYKTLVKLLSKADATAEQHGSERKPIMGWSDIEELAAQNITCGSGCLVGAVSKHLLTEMPGISNETKVAAAKAYFERLHHLFKDRFYAEVFPHDCSKNFVKGVFIDVEKDGVKETLKFYLLKSIKTNQGDSLAENLADNYDKEKHTELLGICNYRVWQIYDKPYKILNITKQNGFVDNECSPWAPNGDLQWGANTFIIGMARRNKVLITPSDDAHMSDKSYKVVQDVRLAQSGDWRFYETYSRKTSDETFEHFKLNHKIQQKEFESWIDNSYQWLDGFKEFKFDTTPQLATRFYPKDTLSYTKQLINKHGRMPKNNPIYLDRLKKELDLLHNNGKIDLLPYFFVDEEICRVYQNQGYVTSPGRGSGAGLLLNYLMGITHVDPIKNDLSLERFINKARIEANSLPDVDNDLSSRDLLVGYTANVIEVLAEDGTTHTLPEGFMVETKEGLVPIEEAVNKQVEFDPWWNNEVC